MRVGCGIAQLVLFGLVFVEPIPEVKERYGPSLYVVAVYAPPKLRYARLKNRSIKNDPKHRFRSIPEKDAKVRDWADIENIEKAGPIAMADFTIINTGTITELKEKTNEISLKIIREKKHK